MGRIKGYYHLGNQKRKKNQANKQELLKIGT